MRISMCCSKIAARSLLALALALSGGAAQALVTLELQDSASATARIAIKDPTRIRVEGARITDVIGAEVQSPENPAGRLAIRAEEHRGEVFVQPLDAAMPATSLFIVTEQATYTLVLAPASIPADTILIRDSRMGLAAGVQGEGLGRLPNYEKALVMLLRSVASDAVPPALRVIERNTPVALWNEAEFTLLREYVGHPRWQVDAFLLTNTSGRQMVIDEREFMKNDVVAVGLEQADLGPGQSTMVRIVRHTTESR